jgi:hypothetical protein
MKYIANLFIGLLALISTANRTNAQAAADPQPDSHFACGTGISPASCRTSLGLIQEVLHGLTVAPSDWRWVVVANSQWQPMRKEMNLAGDSVAFTAPSARTTFIKESFDGSGVLSVMEGRDRVGALRYEPREFRAMRWVLAHEIAHAVCNIRDERRADAGAERLLRGANEEQVCVRRRPLSPNPFLN